MQAALEDTDRDWSDIYINQGTPNVPAPTRHQKETRKTSFPQPLPGSQYPWHLGFKLLTSTAQGINSYCFKPPTLQYFIMEALGN